MLGSSVHHMESRAVQECCVHALSVTVEPWWEKDVTCWLPPPEAKQQGIQKLFVWVVSRVWQGWHISYHTLCFCMVQKKLCSPKMHSLPLNSKTFFFLTLTETGSITSQGLFKRSTVGAQRPGNDSPWQAVLGLASHRLALSTLSQSFPALLNPSKRLLGHIYILKWIVLQGTVNLPIIRHQLWVYLRYIFLMTGIYLNKLSETSWFVTNDISDHLCSRYGGVVLVPAGKPVFPYREELRLWTRGCYLKFSELSSDWVKWGSGNS